MKEQGKPYNNKSSAVNLLHLPHIYVDVAVPDQSVGWYGIHVYEWNKENFTFQSKENIRMVGKTKFEQ